MTEVPGAAAPIVPRQAPALARFVATAEWATEAVLRNAGWAVDLALRLWIAQSFLTSAVMRSMMAPGDAPPGAADVLPDWLYSAALDNLGALVEGIAPLLLLAGLFTRLSAAALLALAIGAMIADTTGAGEARALVLGWYVLAGPGRVSLDSIVANGIRRIPLPFARSARAVADAVQRLLPVYLVGVRLWTAITTLGFVAAIGVTVPSVLVATFAALLAVGLAGRVSALLLLLLPIAAGSMIGVISDYPAATMVLLLLAGPGPLALDELLHRWSRWAIERAAAGPQAEVVIVGGGFAGVAAALKLRDAPCRVTLVDRRNHHLFQPLLYQVATGALAPSDVATPIREIFREQKNLKVLLGECTGVDVEAREVVLATARIPYDLLLLATGSRTGYFGRDEWAGAAPGLKDVDDATEIRRRLLVAFEWAEAATTEATRRRCLTFVVIGGGPTGVELAGAIVELARFGLAGDFRAIDPSEARVVLIQAADRLLPVFPQTLSAAAAKALEAIGVEVRLNARVEGFTEGGVLVSGEELPTAAVFWAAGVAASPVAQWLGIAPADRSGRVRVAGDLSLPDRPEIFVAGDVAAAAAWNGADVPGLAASAKVMGEYVGRVLRARVVGTAPPADFRYRHIGSLATIGRDSAVADFGKVRLTGAVAWWLWGAVHILLLTGVRNRLSVALDWMWAYLTYRQGVRLITGRDPAIWRGPAPLAHTPPADEQGVTAAPRERSAG